MKVTRAYAQHLVDTLWDIGDTNGDIQLVSECTDFSGYTKRVYFSEVYNQYFLTKYDNEEYERTYTHVEFEEVFPKEVTTTIYVTKEQL